jgi:hypothetical protein
LFLQKRARFLWQFAQCARSVAISTDAEGIGALDFQPVGDFLEDECNISIVDWHSVWQLAWYLVNPE